MPEAVIPVASTNSALVLDLRLQPSVRGLRWLLWLHAVPAAALPLLAVDGWPALVLAVGIAASWVHCRRHPAFGFGARAIVGLRLYADGSWQVGDARGWRAAVLESSSALFGSVLALGFRLVGGGHRRRVLVGGELEPGALRRLRAHLLQSNSGTGVVPR